MLVVAEPQNLNQGFVVRKKREKLLLNTVCPSRVTNSSQNAQDFPGSSSVNPKTPRKLLSSWEICWLLQAHGAVFLICCWPQLSKLGLPPLLCQIHMQTPAEKAEMPYFEHMPKPRFNFKLRLLGRASKHSIVLDGNGNSVKKTCLLSQTGNWNCLHSCSLELFFLHPTSGCLRMEPGRCRIAAEHSKPQGCGSR